MPPKVLQKKDNNSGAAGSGVLPIPASARANKTSPPTNKNTTTQGGGNNNKQSKNPSLPPVPKQPAARLKLEIRRLPPGLTLSEFEEALGEEWTLGKGRVDWREYRQGKVKSVGKMPELGRCYVHVLNEALVREFEARFLAVTFKDKAGSWKNNGGGGAPMLGFAMNQRVPVQTGRGKQRGDNRQGTIDQDAEYMAFLEAETQPIPKAAAIDSAATGGDRKEEEVSGGKGVKVKSTPLIEDLRERKANKAKAAASKAEKADRKGGKNDAKGDENAPANAASGGKKGDKGKVEQAAKDGAKAANKQAANKQAQNNKNNDNNSSSAANSNANAASQKAAQTPAKGRRGAANQNAKAAAAASQQPQQQSQQQPATPAGPAAQRGQRQRGNAEGIKKMLQKDLGIKPKAAAAAAAANQTTQAAASPAATPPASNQQTPAQSKNSSPAQTPKQQQQQQNSGPPKAYLKHANPSQGMTEILIQQALAQFGEMNNVTIDPRKGTAIAVFKTQEGLKKAVEAKKVPVANGAVEVLSFKDRGGGGGGGGGGGNNASGSGGGGGGGAGGGGGRGGFRNRGGGGRAGRGNNANANSGAGGGNANANAGKGGGQAAGAGAG